ncbi:hypothetical protein P3T73_08315 [Kiritimatiellota bacterium B12222]|nr:hypothetical protein P3T73_08315 [Kiritimatiellota bacterium B12222]
MKNILSLPFVILLLVCASCGRNSFPVEAQQTVMFNVSGLTTQEGVDELLLAVESLEGVGLCEAWPEQGSMVVEYQPRVISMDEIQNSINALGYEATFPED